MNGFNVMFTKSTDHGATWSTPVKTYGKVSWNDKPILATSDNGQDVYVSWNGPQSGDPYVAQSHDAGVTWTQTKIVNSSRYFFAFDGDVLPNGTVVFSETSFDYGGPGSTLVGQAQVNVLRSTNNGASWTANLVDTVELAPICTAAGCPEDYYPGHSAVTADGNGNVVLLYDGATVSHGNETIWERRSTDGGASWTTRQALSTAGEMADFPAAESRLSGDVRMWYMQTNGGNFDAERLVPEFDGRRRYMGCAREDLRRNRRSGLQDRERVPGALRRLRRDRDHERRQGDRDLGRGE
jgi:hypothetical protein